MLGSVGILLTSLCIVATRGWIYREKNYLTGCMLFLSINYSCKEYGSPVTYILLHF